MKQYLIQKLLEDQCFTSLIRTVVSVFLDPADRSCRPGLKKVRKHLRTLWPRQLVDEVPVVTRSFRREVSAPAGKFRVS